MERKTAVKKEIEIKIKIEIEIVIEKGIAIEIEIEIEEEVIEIEIGIEIELEEMKIVAQEEKTEIKIEEEKLHRLPRRMALNPIARHPVEKGAPRKNEPSSSSSRRSRRISPAASIRRIASVLVCYPYVCIPSYRNCFGTWALFLNNE